MTPEAGLTKVSYLVGWMYSLKEPLSHQEKAKLVSKRLVASYFSVYVLLL